MPDPEGVTSLDKFALDKQHREAPELIEPETPRGDIKDLDRALREKGQYAIDAAAAYHPKPHLRATK